MTRAALLLAALAAATAATVEAAGGPSLIDSFAGVYADRHPNGDISGAKYATDDVLEIVKVSSTQAYVRVHLTFYNGHVCAVWGVARLEGDALLYRPRDNIEGKCALSLKRQGSRLVFGDEGDACKFDFCGARGILNGASFPLSARRPIHYLPRLLASREYAEAMAEHGLPAPPPHVAVSVTPMHSDGSVVRYPRLTVFADSIARAKVNALLAKLEAGDRKDRDDCLSDARAAPAPGPASYNVRIDVAYLTPRYLSMQIRRSYDCGGPYPDNAVPAPLTIDLSTAQEVDWHSIFKPGFLFSFGRQGRRSLGGALSQALSLGSWQRRRLPEGGR